MTLTEQQIAAAPKVVLHDHLDGGLRPGTVLDLARAQGHPLPADDEPALAAWFAAAADSGSLETYLETFSHTVAVLQDADSLFRVAKEWALDQAADGVVYAEARYAPELHLDGGLSLDEVVEAVDAGMAAGELAAAAAGTPVLCRTLLTAMRHAARSTEIAELAVRHRGGSVVGFDIAGAEAGYPPSRHLAAFDYLHRQNFPLTIHAGEAFGLPSIWEAVQLCGADRLGHGVRIVDDLHRDESGELQLGPLAHWVRDKRIPLEMCPSSNVQTGAAPDIAGHPITLLKNLRFRVTVNCDNRLMSSTTMTREMTLLVEQAGWTWADLRWVTVNAMKSAFIHFDRRLELINDVIKPGWDVLSD